MRTFFVLTIRASFPELKRRCWASKSASTSAEERATMFRRQRRRRRRRWCSTSVCSQSFTTKKVERYFFQSNLEPHSLISTFLFKQPLNYSNIKLNFVLNTGTGPKHTSLLRNILLVKRLAMLFDP